MEIIIAIGVTVVAALAFIFRRRPRVRHATVDYLIPSKEDQPLTPREVFVAGINHVGMCGEHRQELIAKLRRVQFWSLWGTSSIRPDWSDAMQRIRVLSAAIAAIMAMCVATATAGPT